MNTNLDYFKKFFKKDKYQTGGDVPGNPYKDPLDLLNEDINNNFEEENVNPYSDSTTLGVQDLFNPGLSTSPFQNHPDNDRGFTAEQKKNLILGNSSSYEDFLSNQPSYTQRELEDMLLNNEISPEQYSIEFDKLNSDNSSVLTSSPFLDSEGRPMQGGEDTYLKYLQGLGRGVSLENALFSLGQSVAYEGENRSANLLRGVGATGKTLLAGGRNFLSGYGFQNRSQETMKTFEERIAEDRRSNIEFLEQGGTVVNPQTNEKIKPVSLEEEAILNEKGFRKERKSENLSLEEMLVSEKITGNKEEVGNVEVERGEYLMYPEGEIQEVVGKNHDKGGETMNLPQGTLILSNSLQVDKKLAKELNETYGVKVSTKHTYAEAVSKFTDKIGITKLTKDQEFLINKLKELDTESPSYSVNSKYIEGRLREIEERRDGLNEKRKTVFSLLYEKQESSKPKTSDTQDFFENGGKVTRAQLQRINAGELELVGDKLIDVETGVTIADGITAADLSTADIYGISFSENRFSDSDEFKRLHQSASKEGGFGKITKDNLEETIKWAYENFPDIASRPDVFGASYNDDGEFTFNKDVNFTKANDNVKKYQALVNARMNSTADDVINNADLYGEEAVKAAEEYKNKQTFDNSLARKVDDGLWGNFSSGRFSLKTQVVTPEELESLRTQNIFSVKDLIKATDEGNVELSKTSLDRLNSIKNTLSDTSDFGLQSYTLGEISKIEPEKPVTEVIDPIDNTATLSKKEQGEFIYLAPDQSLLPPSAIEPHLKVKNRFQRIDPVEIGIERNIQESYRQQEFAEEQLKGLPPSQRAAVLSNMTANTQKNINDVITQTNIVNAQNKQKAEQFNIGQADRENLAEGQNALNFERLQLTAKAKTEKDLRDYFAFNREVQLNNILREQQLSQIDALSEDFSVDPFGNVKFDPTYEYRFNNPTS